MKPPWRNIAYEQFMAERCMAANPGFTVYVGWDSDELVFDEPQERKKEDGNQNTTSD